jgi:hypothetical protein
MIAPKPGMFSSEVDIQMIVGDQVLSVSQIGPERLTLESAVSLPPLRSGRGADSGWPSQPLDGSLAGRGIGGITSGEDRTTRLSRLTCSALGHFDEHCQRVLGIDEPSHRPFEIIETSDGVIRLPQSVIAGKNPRRENAP